MTTARRSILLAAVAAAGLAAAGCGGQTLDTADLEQQVTDQLEQNVGERPASVECPDDIEVREGNTARCTITASDGSTIGATVTLTNDEGGFELQVDEQLATP